MAIKKRFFVSGILQGSEAAGQHENQDYRAEIQRIISSVHPQAIIYDPIGQHLHQAEKYNDGRARLCFWAHVLMAGESDVVIAFMPRASNGTIIECYEGWINGALVLVVSPLNHNWAIKAVAHKIVPSLDELHRFLEAPAFSRALQPRRRLERKNRAGQIFSRAPKFQSWQD